MTDRALILLLEEWHRQLSDALQVAMNTLPRDPDPERVRAWTGIGALKLRSPTEDDPSDEWSWVEYPKTHPALSELETTILRIGEHIERLRGDDA